MATPKMTGIDIAWSIAMVSLNMTRGIGGLMLSAIHFKPKFLLVGFGLGKLITLLVIGVATRRFLDPAVHRRWVEQFEGGRAKASPPIAWLAGCVISKVIKLRKTGP